MDPVRDLYQLIPRLYSQDEAIQQKAVQSMYAPEAILQHPLAIAEGAPGVLSLLRAWTKTFRTIDSRVHHVAVDPAGKRAYATVTQYVEFGLPWLGNLSTGTVSTFLQYISTFNLVRPNLMEMDTVPSSFLVGPAVKTDVDTPLTNIARVVPLHLVMVFDLDPVLGAGAVGGAGQSWVIKNQFDCYFTSPFFPLFGMALADVVDITYVMPIQRVLKLLDPVIDVDRSEKWIRSVFVDPLMQFAGWTSLAVTTSPLEMRVPWTVVFERKIRRVFGWGLSQFV